MDNKEKELREQIAIDVAKLIINRDKNWNNRDIAVLREARKVIQMGYSKYCLENKGVKENAR